MRTYILYDGRAVDGDTSKASVLSCCATYKEAWAERKDYGGESVCYSYRDNGKELTDERYEFMWFRGEDSQEIRNQVSRGPKTRAAKRRKRQNYRRNVKARKLAEKQGGAA